MELHVDLISHLKCTLIFVRMLFHLVSSNFHVFFQGFKQIIATLEGGVNRMVHGSPREVKEDRWWQNAVNRLKRGHIDGGVKRGVILPLSPMKKIGPTVRISSDETTEVILEGSVQNLGLAVGLRMISGVVAEFGALQFEEVVPETSQKG